MDKKIYLSTGAPTIKSAMLPKAENVTLRLAEPKDIPQIARLERSAFDAALYGGSIMSDRSIHNFISRANALLMLVEKDGQAAGYALILFRRNSAKARFYSLAVDPARQGEGLGSILFDAVEEISRKAGATELLLEIREDNETLKNRYGKKGYKPYRLVPDYYGDGAGAVKMWRSL